MFEKSITELSRAMKEGNFTSEQLTSFYLRRISLFDGVLRSMITVNPAAAAIAREMDMMRRGGKILGPLHGIPVILKDNFDTRDMPTTSGARALANFRPGRDAFTVDKMRQAGAVLIGKANLSELAKTGMSASTMVGQTLNPYDLTRTPGGSSGGTGAAIAANFAAVGAGSDTVNSIRSPASANSLVGIRPTMGLVSRNGVLPCSFHHDQVGPIARTVMDAAILLGVMVGYDPADRATAIIKDRPAPDFFSAPGVGGLSGRRIVLVRNNIGDHPEVRRIVEQTVADFKELGASILVEDIPELDVPALLRNNDVQQWEWSIELNRYLASHGSAAPVKNIRELIATGLLLADIDCGTADMTTETDLGKNAEYNARLEKNISLRAFIEGYMEKNGVDAFLYPHQTVLVVHHNDPRGQAGRNGFMAAAAGLPAIVFPGGFSNPSSTAPLGVPIGMELMGRSFDEIELIRMAFAYEQLTKHRKPPLSVPDVDFARLFSRVE